MASLASFAIQPCVAIGKGILGQRLFKHIFVLLRHGTHILHPLDNELQSIRPFLFENIRVPPLDGSNLRSGLGNLRRPYISGGTVILIKRKSSAESTDSVERRNVQKWS